MPKPGLSTVSSTQHPLSGKETFTTLLTVMEKEGATKNKLKSYVRAELFQFTIPTIPRSNYTGATNILQMRHLGPREVKGHGHTASRR